jgi:hypothetical protein
VRTMYDACDYLRPPADAAMVAGYVSGGCQWSPAAWSAWSKAITVRIDTVAAIGTGVVLDVERGDATPEDAPNWCAQARQRGVTPTVYCSQSNVAAVLAACKLHGVPAPLIWMALWDGVAEVPAGCIAKQYTNDASAGYDISAVADYWPGVDPAPSPVVEVEPMHLFVIPMPTGVWCLYEASGRYSHVVSSDDIAAIKASGGTGPEPLTQAQHEVYLATFITPPANAALAPAVSGGTTA